MASQRTSSRKPIPLHLTWHESFAFATMDSNLVPAHLKDAINTRDTRRRQPFLIFEGFLVVPSTLPSKKLIHNRPYFYPWTAHVPPFVSCLCAQSVPHYEIAKWQEVGHARAGAGGYGCFALVALEVPGDGKTLPPLCPPAGGFGFDS